jgi:hypothetical protein
MYLILCDSTGNRYEGMVLATSEHGLRVALRGGEDAIELTHHQNQWTMEGDGAIEIESMLAGERPLAALLSPVAYPLAG